MDLFVIESTTGIVTLSDYYIISINLWVLSTIIIDILINPVINVTMSTIFIIVIKLN